MDKSGFLSADYSSPIGEIRLLSCGGNLVGLWFLGQRHFMEGYEAPQIPKGTDAIIEKTFSWLGEYFAGLCPDPGEIPLKPAGSEFQLLVWEELLKIPYGQTKSYGEIAGEISYKTGRKTSPRAVGSAVARNPISIIIPCHRVVSSAGKLTGYSAGIDKKKFLLDLEGRKDSSQ